MPLEDTTEEEAAAAIEVGHEVRVLAVGLTMNDGAGRGPSRRHQPVPCRSGRPVTARSRQAASLHPRRDALEAELAAADEGLPIARARSPRNGTPGPRYRTGGRNATGAGALSPGT